MRSSRRTGRPRRTRGKTLHLHDGARTGLRVPQEATLRLQSLGRPDPGPSLKHRVSLLQLGTFAILGICVAVVTFVLWQVSIEMRYQQDTLIPAATAARDLQTAVLVEEATLRGYVLEPTPSLLKGYEAATVDEETQRKILSSLQDDLPSTKADELYEKLDDWHDEVASPALEAVASGDRMRAESLAGESTRAHFVEIRADLNELTRILVAARQTSTEKVSRAITELGVAVFFLAVVGLCCALGVHRGLRRWVLQPLQDLSAQVTTIAIAENTRTPVSPSGLLEFRSLGEDIESMRKRLVNRIEVAERADEALSQRGEIVVRLREDLSASHISELPVDHAGWLRPSIGIVAGDWYDLVPTTENHMALVIVDVAGHGAIPGMFAYRLKYLLLGFLMTGSAPGEALRSISQQLGDVDELFATVLVVDLDLSTQTVRYASAGHHPLKVYNGGTWYSYGATGPLLGPGDLLGEEWETRSFSAKPGMFLVGYTDGVVEARNPDQEEFGSERLCAVVGSSVHAGPHAVAEAVQKALETFTEGARLQDDCTFVALRWGKEAVHLGETA